ncbi:hypothetical protein PR003_g31490 [Phytophthora rubi]|uniref:RxLR effector protein n=1 Tax=Phytophthora rubi TaxID=129364 RepID=A0A6A4B5C9_9STRA|nr:hypothetical protein PR003_g31490 [Phytophthora rubi]
MRRCRWIIFVALAALLSTSSTTSAFESVKGPASGGVLRTKDSTSRLKGWQSDDRRFLRSDTNSPQPDIIDEERDTGISVLFGKLKNSVGKLKLQYADSRKNKFLKKMEEMYQGGSTPEKLAELYGSTKKLKLQEDFVQYYKWRQSWTAQGRVYPRPGTVKRVPTLKRLD